jgi:hypothetical protein
MIPLPANAEDSLRINWHLSQWCNYSCQYCQVLVFHQRSPLKQVQNHSFDYHPVEQWLEAIGRFPQRHIHLKITGGEPFLDRKNFRELLAGLSAMKHIRVGIDTNGYWDPSYYAGLDKSGIFLNVTFHPTQTDFPGFFERVLAIRDAGFTVAMVNYVVAPENMEFFETAFARLEAEGFCVNASTMIQTGLYLSRTERTEAELDLVVRYNTPLDLHFKLLQPETKGRPCFYPAMTYSILYDGKISVGCMDRYQDLFTEGIPELPRSAVACPLQQCEGCTDMYRALTDEPRLTQPLKLYTLEDYAREFSDYRRKQNVDDPEVRRREVAYWLEQVEEKRRKAEAAVRLVMIGNGTIGNGTAPPPADAIFGYVDVALDGKFYLEAHSRDRVWISGWVASGRHGAPVREVNLKIQGQHIATIRDFYPRPDVASHFGRQNLLHSGWRALVYLPALRPGQYELMVEATGQEGISGALAPWPVRIVE